MRLCFLKLSPLAGILAAGVLHMNPVVSAQDSSPAKSSNVSASQQEKALTLNEVKVIPLADADGRLARMGFDSKRNRLLVPASNAHKLFVIDVEKGEVIQSLDIQSPLSAAYIPDFDVITIGSNADRSIHILNAETFERQSPLEAVPDVDTQLYDSATKRLYVSMRRKSVGVIDMQNRKLVQEVQVGGPVQGLALAPQSKKLFASVIVPAQIAVIDVDSLAVTTNWPLKDSPSNGTIALDEVNNRLFIATRRPARIMMMDTAKATQTGSVQILSDCDGLFFESGYVFASCGAGVVDAFQQVGPDEYRLTARKPTAESARASFLVPALKKIFVACPGNRSGNTPCIKVFEYH